MRCAAVTFDMRDKSYGESAAEAELGDLLWNPKGGDGHVLMAELRCGSRHNGHLVDCGCGGWGMNPCPSTTLVCECGEDGSWRDHHYVLLARVVPAEVPLSGRTADTHPDSTPVADRSPEPRPPDCPDS